MAGANACMLRITAVDGTTSNIPESSVYHVNTSSVLESHCLGKRILEAHYRLDRNTDVNALAIPIYNGANILYEYGWYENSGAFVVSLSNRP